VNTYLGCQGNYRGIIGVFNGIDTYLQIADQKLCSSSCPCYLTNASDYQRNNTLSTTVANWVYSSDASSQATSFTNCTSLLQEQTYKLAKASNPNFDPDNTFRADKFADYMRRIEEKFSCTGWCSVSYYSPPLFKQILMGKFLFRDINTGPPQYLGCLNQVITWVPAYLNAWGSVVMVLFGFQLMTLILAMCQCWAREKDHEQQVPHHHDDIRS